jgi:hypothetical protein
MMKLLIIFLILVTGVNTLQAQLKVDIPTEFYRNILRDGDLPENVEGTPYFNKKFTAGEVFIKNNEPFSAMLRYDAFRDNLEMQKGDEFTSLLKRDYIYAKIGKETVKIFNYINDRDETREGYFTQLTHGKTLLLKKKKKVFKPAEASSSTYKKDSPPRLIDEIDYYLIIDNSIAEKIRLKKKSVLKALRAYPEAVKITQQRKMKLSSEEEVIQLIQLLSIGNNNTK